MFIFKSIVISFNEIYEFKIFFKYKNDLFEKFYLMMYNYLLKKIIIVIKIVCI